MGAVLYWGCFRIGVQNLVCFQPCCIKGSFPAVKNSEKKSFCLFFLSKLKDCSQRGRRPEKEEGRETIVRSHFPKKCIKMKRIGPRRGRPKFHSVDPQLK